MQAPAAIPSLFAPPSFTIIEVGTAVLLLLIAFTASLPPGFQATAWRRWTAPLVKRPWVCVLLTGLAGPAIRLAVLPLLPVPQPFFHDEFSYLLAADTFSSGRLTNPTHPMWMHLETFHVNFLPTYMSMYFPGQGLLLALGKVVFGKPWFGVLVAVGGMCAAMTWMLQGWVAAEWALLGGMLVVFRLGVCGYWMNSYFGGELPAIGGALLLGALPRFTRSASPAASVCLAVGLALLINSRPFEGLILCLPVAGMLLRYCRNKQRESGLGFFWRRLILPAAMVLVPVVAALAYYDWRVYGSPTVLPYRTNRATYAVSPYFLWQTPAPEPPYRHKEIRNFYINYELDAFLRARTAAGFFEGVARRVVTPLHFFFGPLLIIPLLVLPRVARDPRGRLLFGCLLVVFIGFLANAFVLPHYFAPAAGVFYAILALSMEKLAEWRPGGKPCGPFLLTAIPVVSVGLFGAQLAIAATAPHPDRPRTTVLRTLENQSGRQLAIVRYAPDHDPRDEWVYNAADIDAAKIVWARAMGKTEDTELMRYFGDRTVWLIEPDQQPPRVTRYAP